MKRVYITTALSCLVMLAVFVGCFRFFRLTGRRDHIKIGFIYDNDESTAYTYNFSLAKDAVEKKYGDKAEILTSSNVLDEDMEEPLRAMADNGCDIIFLNGYSDLVRQLAPEYPATQFCQTSYMDMNGQTVPENYHTFKGEAYQGRYVSGIAAGMKIKQLISEGIISKEQAIVGFVAAFPTPEVISGYTAFILGVRQVVPDAVIRVSYTGTWSSYALEKKYVKDMIDDGCVIISHHTDTIAPAVACEEANSRGLPVYYVGLNQSMFEVAPGSYLVTARLCWEPYILSAVEAVMTNRTIESVISGNVHGTDASAGFEHGWVEINDLNLQVAAPGTKEAMDKAIEKFKHGKVDFVYKGSYTGVDPENPSDTCDLSTGYIENKFTSYPTFHYILSGVVTVMD